MLQKVLFCVLLGVGCGALFEQSLKFPSWGKGINRFTQQGEAAIGSHANLLDKLKTALLIKGQPMNGLSPNALLPLFGLKQPSTSGQQTSKAGKVRLQSYSIANCSQQAADKAIFVVDSLTVQPDPLSMPGDLTFAFNINLKQDIDELEAQVDFWKKVGSVYIKIPCIGLFGSCSYKVCEELKQVASCPEKFKEDKIPCQCPFEKGQYTEPGITAEIDGDVFPSGDYKATANMTAVAGGEMRFVGCYNVKFTIAEGN